MGFKKRCKAVLRKVKDGACEFAGHTIGKALRAALTLDYIFRHPDGTDTSRKLRIAEEVLIAEAKHNKTDQILLRPYIFSLMGKIYRAEGDGSGGHYTRGYVYMERRLSFLMTKMQMRPSYDAVAVRRFNTMLKVIEELGGYVYARDDSSVEVEVEFPSYWTYERADFYITYEQLAFIHKMEDIYLKDVYDNPNKED